MVTFLKKTFSPLSQPQLYVILLLFLFPLLSALPGRLLSSGFETTNNFFCLPPKPNLAMIISPAFVKRNRTDFTTDDLTIADSFGVLLIGAFVTMGLYGITVLQTYFYYLYYPRDDWSIKCLVGGVWILDTLHIVLMCHAVHYYLVQTFGTYEQLDGVWSLYSSLAINISVIFVAKCFFIIRIYALCPLRFKPWVTGLVAFTVFLYLCFGIETVVNFFIKKKFVRLKETKFIAVLPFGIMTVLSDIVIALVLCILFYNHRSEFQETNHIINKLIIFAINRCILTSAAAIVEVVLFSVMPNPFYTFALDFVIGKLYANSLLASLNSRENVRSNVTDCDLVSTNFIAADIITTEQDLQRGSRENCGNIRSNDAEARRNLADPRIGQGARRGLGYSK